MYTIFPMPKTKNLKGPYRVFLLKLYREDVKRWGEIYWTAEKRAAERREKVDASIVNEALLGMTSAQDWVVSDEERLYFQGRLRKKPKTLVDLTPQQILKLYQGGITEEMRKHGGVEKLDVKRA